MATEKKAKKSPKKRSDKALKSYKLGGFKFSLVQMALVGLVFAAMSGYFIWKTFALPPDPPAVQVVINEPGYGPTGPKTITITSGQGISVGWYSANAASCQWDPSWSGSPANTGGSWQYQDTGALGSGIYIYNLVCHNFNGSASDSITVNVNNPPPPPTPSVSLSGNPTTITQGQYTTLSWSSSNAAYCSTGWSGTNNTSGSAQVAPSSTTTYVMSCWNSAGAKGDSNPVTITVNSPPPPPPAPTVSINASPGTIDKGASSTLGWSSNNASSCSASGAWSGSKSTAGQQTVSPSTSSTYVISCSGSGGSNSASTTVTVRNTPPPPAAPAVKLVSSPSSIAYNGSTYLQWSSSNASSCSASWTGSHATSGSQQVGPLTATKTYSISCSGPGGTATDSAAVSVAKAPAGCPPNCPKPAAPPAPTTALAPPTPTSTSTSDEIPTLSNDFSSTTGDNSTQQKKRRNWLRDFLLGGLLGLLTGQAKGGK